LKQPETWDDVYDAGMQLTNPPDWYGFSIRGLGYSATTLTVVNNFIYGWGGDYLNADMSPAFNDPKIVEAFEFARKLYGDTCSPGAPSYDWPEVLLEVQQGRAMTAFEMTWAGPSAGWIKDQVAPEVYQNVYYALPPKGPAGISAPAFWGWGWGINKYSKHKGATWHFLQWLSSKEKQNEWHWDLGYPNRISVFDTPEAKKELGSFDNWVSVMLGAFDLADKNKTPPKIPESVEIQESIATAWNATISGSMDARKALDIAADAVDKAMRKAGYY